MTDKANEGRKALVSLSALSQVLEALNGPNYLILELLHTRRLPASLGLPDNPIYTLERELADAMSGKSPELHTNVMVSNISVNVDKEIFEECMTGMLKNYARIGGDTEGDKLLSQMIAESLVITRWTDADGNVYYGLDRYNHATGALEIVLPDEYETPRAALAAHYVKASLGAAYV